MHRLSLFISLLTSVTLSFAAVIPRAIEVEKYNGDVNGRSYIVKFRDDADRDSILSGIIADPNAITRKWDPAFMNGFAAPLSDAELLALQSNPDVEYITQDGIMTVSDAQRNAPWNLARVSSRYKLGNQNPTDLNYEYDYAPEPGKDVDIYVVDTGIYTDHLDFGGRATWGGTFCDGCKDADGHGHGTHVAGTAGGKRFGVAKSASLIAVKVLGDNGSGAISGIIDGLQWIRQQHYENDRPTIATMSLGGSKSTAMDDAVRRLIRDGIHCTVAAGNSNEDAGNTSPADVAEAITVGATDITDARASYSNFGSVVDVFAPGSSVTSTWIDGGDKVLSGTSMATPSVAGLVAYFLNIFGRGTTPQQMRDYIVQFSNQNQLTGIPSGTANRLAFNNYQQ